MGCIRFTPEEIREHYKDGVHGEFLIDSPRGKALFIGCSTRMVPIIIRSATIKGKGMGSWWDWPRKGTQQVP